MVDLIEKKTNSKVVLAQKRSNENMSPYAIEQDWFMNSSKLKNSGLNLMNTEEMVQNILKDWII